MSKRPVRYLVFIVAVTSLLTFDFLVPPRPSDVVHEPSTLYFSDTFDSEDDTFVPPWDKIYQVADGRITTDAFARKGARSAKFTTMDGDNYGGWPGQKTEIAKDNVSCEGDDQWFGWSTYLPADWPTIQPDFESIAEFGYSGNSLPPMHFDAEDYHTIALKDQNHENKWQGSSTPGAWEDFVMHVKFSKDPNVGFVELWVNGDSQTMINGQQRIYFSTLNSTDPGRCGGLHLNNNRGDAWNYATTIYHDEMKVGISYAIVDPAA